jgi:hypothetical protein
MGRLYNKWGRLYTSLDKFKNIITFIYKINLLKIENSHNLMIFIIYIIYNLFYDIYFKYHYRFQYNFIKNRLKIVKLLSFRLI